MTPDEFNNIQYPYTKDEYTNAPTPLFGTIWKSITLAPPPNNKQSLEELNEIMTLHNKYYRQYESTIVKHDIDNLEKHFITLIIQSGNKLTDEQREFIEDISSELTTIGAHYKNVFLRARPKQLFQALNYDFNPGAKTDKSPSYPSTHALIGHFLGQLLSKAYPQLHAQIQHLANNLGKGRVIAGLHYPTDYYAGRWLADELMKIIKAK